MAAQIISSVFRVVLGAWIFVSSLRVYSSDMVARPSHFMIVEHGLSVPSRAEVLVHVTEGVGTKTGVSSERT